MSDISGNAHLPPRSAPLRTEAPSSRIPTVSPSGSAPRVDFSLDLATAGEISNYSPEHDAAQTSPVLHHGMAQNGPHTHENSPPASQNSSERLEA